MLCQQLYESSDSQLRIQAEKALVTFAESSDSLPQCQVVLERSQVHIICVNNVAVLGVGHDVYTTN